MGYHGSSSGKHIVMSSSYSSSFNAAYERVNNSADAECGCACSVFAPHLVIPEQLCHINMSSFLCKIESRHVAACQE